MGHVKLKPKSMRRNLEWLVLLPNYSRGSKPLLALFHLPIAFLVGLVLHIAL